MYQVIHVSEDKDAVIVITPPDATHETPGVKCYVIREVGPSEVLKICGSEPDRAAALARKPDKTFKSFDEIVSWAKSRRAIA